MLSKHKEESRTQLSVVSLEDLVPKDHLVRKIEQAIDFNFIYDIVQDKYCLDNGRPSVDPVVIIKIVFIQYLFGIRSMRQTIKEIETNNAYRWFIGYDFTEKIPHFTTFGKNYVRRFKDTNLFEMIFERILEEAMNHGLVDPEVVFIDSTHVKANANKKHDYVYDEDGFFKKHDYVYDEYYDCYICPNNEILRYTTTNREGYKEYKSNPRKCISCPFKHQCTENKDNVKLVTRHIWAEYLEEAEHLRHTSYNKAIYEQRKQTIERYLQI